MQKLSFLLAILCIFTMQQSYSEENMMRLVADEIIEASKNKQEDYSVKIQELESLLLKLHEYYASEVYRLLMGDDLAASTERVNRAWASIESISARLVAYRALQMEAEEQTRPIENIKKR